MSRFAKFWLYFFGFIILFPTLSGYLGLFLSVFAIPLGLIVGFVLFIWQVCHGLDELDEQDRENKDR